MSCRRDTLLRLLLYKRPSPSRLCAECLSSRHSRQYSAAATAAQPVEEAFSPPSIPIPQTSDSIPVEKQPGSGALELPYNINAAVILSRAPVLTRELTPFEKAFFLYQRRLNERLALPFKREFYFEKRTPAELEFRRRMRERRTPARDIGVYSGYGKDAWNDEVLVGSDISEPEHQKEALVKDSEVEVKKRNAQGEEELVKEEVERPMPRRTTADEDDDRRSLNRAMDRTLYLVVKRPQDAYGQWMFPEAKLLLDESLHKAAERIITDSAGNSMNTWVVGKTPIAFHTRRYAISKGQDKPTKEGEKTFYIKARIMAGKAILQDNKMGLLDYQWLAKDEIEKLFSPLHWSAVKNALVER